MSQEQLDSERRGRLASTQSRAVLEPVLGSLVDRFGAPAMARVVECIEIAIGKRVASFEHPLQRPAVIYFPGLTAQPWYDPRGYVASSAVVDALEGAFAEIRREAEHAMQRQNDWSQYVSGDYANQKFYPLTGSSWSVLHVRGDGAVEATRALCPATARVIDRIEPYLSAAGEVLFSLLRPGVHLPPHRDNTNLKLTVHLPLIIPSDCAIRVGGETRSWVESKCVMFDDTFLHEAWNRGSEDRVCLLLDVWHPELTRPEIEALGILAPQIKTLLRTASSAA